MIISNRYFAILLTMLIPPTAHAAKQCVMCQPGQYSDSTTGGVCKECPTGSYCMQGTKFGCSAGHYQNQAGQSSCTQCLPGTKSNEANTGCVLKENLTLNKFALLDNDTTPGYDGRGKFSNTGTLAPGVYRVVLGGGNGGCNGGGVTGAQLTFNFFLPKQADYALAAGSDGSCAGEGAGGAGSFLKLDIDGTDYYFAAGGERGHCGGGGGGIGAGGGAGNSSGCYNVTGGSVGPYLGGSGCKVGQGLNTGGYSSNDDAPGGGNGGTTEMCLLDKKTGCSVISTINIIDHDGVAGVFEERIGGHGMKPSYCIVELNSKAPDGLARATHKTNVPDPDTCLNCAKLYKLD